MIVRRERPADHAAVRSLHRAAFRPAGAAGGEVVEARLVDELREDAGFLPHLSLVATDAGADGEDVVGHVIARGPSMGSRSRIRNLVTLLAAPQPAAGW